MKILTSPQKIFDNILKDIRNAKRSIYIEIYKFNSDSVGRFFLDELLKAKKRGVKVFVLVDYVGSNVTNGFFNKLTNFRYFKKLHFQNLFEGHKRNHRKLIVIDEKIGYLGSINFTEECLVWVELMVRFRSPEISEKLILAFNQNWRLYKSYIYSKRRQSKKIMGQNFEIIRDVPSIIYQRTKKEYLKTIRNSRKYIYIITPYFLPDKKIRRALKKAKDRKVDIRIITPKITDHVLINGVKNRFLYSMVKKGIKAYEYPSMVHSKLLITDKEYLFGSSNVDYRSFLFQYELNIKANDEGLHGLLLKKFQSLFNKSKKFNIKEYKKNSLMGKLFEKILFFYRKYL